MLPELINSGRGTSATTSQSFADALEEALNYNGIFVINAIVPRNDHSHNLRKLGQAIKTKRSHPTNHPI